MHSLTQDTRRTTRVERPMHSLLIMGRALDGMHKASISGSKDIHQLTHRDKQTMTVSAMPELLTLG